jgi:hypothetical protein
MALEKSYTSLPGGGEGDDDTKDIAESVCEKAQLDRDGGG